MKIAITGATGGLGRNLVDFFHRRGDDVTALGRNETIGRSLGVRFLAGDLADATYVKQSLAGQDVVIHSAALASPWGHWSDFEKANVIGTQNVVDSSRECSRLVYISTPSIYFSGFPASRISESDPLPEPATHYARSKLMGEKIVRSSELTTFTLRPRALFGPHDAVILPRIIRVMKRGVFPLPARGDALTDVTYVDNVVHAVALCLTADKRFSGRAYNITNDESMSIRELTRLVSEAMKLDVKFVNAPLKPLMLAGSLLEKLATHVTHREPLLTRYSVGLLGITQTLDISRAKEDLGYKPIVSVREGLTRYTEWLEDAR
jgi:nucleoside-diphosphate-sugar epimerase